MILEVSQINKKFRNTQAVRDVSFQIPKGVICGLLGPNGAGKTTIIRMIMDIIKPDSGTITLGDGLDADARKDHIGYLPEERGLYTKTKVRETLIYFAKLKGLSAQDARTNADFYLDRLRMTDTADTQIKKLSKGNQQKIQLISAVISKPRLLILDEPFSGLDPINVKVVSELIVELKQAGTSIVLSTHQMNQVESFCERMFLFNKGSLLLQGEVNPIIERYSGQFLMVETDQPLPESQLYTIEEQQGGRHRLKLLAPRGELLAWLGAQAFETKSLTPYRVPLSEIFIREVQGHE